MSFLDRLLRRKPVQEITPTPENVPVQDKQQSHGVETDTSHGENETLTKINNNIELAIAELKGLYVMLKSHDQRLIKHDQVNAEYLTEILLQNKAITPEKKPEVQAILTEAMTKNETKAETVEKLMSLGVPRATAYRYAKGQSHDDENETAGQSQA